MNGEVVLITGAATGIGAETARQMAALGGAVAVCDVNETDGAALAEEIGGTFIRCDVRSHDSMQAALVRCEETLGTPRYAHLNAGVMTVPAGEPMLAIEDVSPDQYRRIVGINLDGVWHGLKVLLPVVRKHADGAVTITASIAGLGAVAADPLYTATKYALIGLTRAVAAANEDSGVRINAICPGVVDTAIVPPAYRAPEFGVMSPSTMAAEIVELLRSGANGEVRVKLKDREAFAVTPTSLDA